MRTLLAVLVAVIFVSEAVAQPVCSTRANFLLHAAQRYEEYPTASGLASNGSVLEVLASENGSWTIIITQPNGTACLVASGEAWSTIPIVERGPKT